MTIIFIASDDPMRIPDVALCTINDSLSSLHFHHNASELNNDNNISNELTMNNNDCSSLIDYSSLTIANRLSFDNVTPIPHVMMTPTAPPLNEVLYVDNDEHMSNTNLYCDYDDESVYEIGPIDRQDYDLILESGCTHHMVCNSLLLKNIIYNDKIDSLCQIRQWFLYPNNRLWRSMAFS